MECTYISCKPRGLGGNIRALFIWGSPVLVNLWSAVTCVDGRSNLKSLNRTLVGDWWPRLVPPLVATVVPVGYTISGSGIYVRSWEPWWRRGYVSSNKTGSVGSVGKEVVDTGHEGISTALDSREDAVLHIFYLHMKFLLRVAQVCSSFLDVSCTQTAECDTRSAQLTAV